MEILFFPMAVQAVYRLQSKVGRYSRVQQSTRYTDTCTVKVPIQLPHQVQLANMGYLVSTHGISSRVLRTCLVGKVG